MPRQEEHFPAVLYDALALIGAAAFTVAVQSRVLWQVLKLRKYSDPESKKDHLLFTTPFLALDATLLVAGVFGLQNPRPFDAVMWTLTVGLVVGWPLLGAWGFSRYFARQLKNYQKLFHDQP